jgi:hypothetical protein
MEKNFDHFMKTNSVEDRGPKKIKRTTEHRTDLEEQER